MDRDLDVVPVRLVDNSGDLVIGDRLYIAPSRVGDLDQIDSPLATTRPSLMMVEISLGRCDREAGGFRQLPGELPRARASISG